MDQGSTRRSVRRNHDGDSGITARKRFGQHFLIDRNVVERIHATLAIQTHESIVEIGPGQGALTDGLTLATSNLTLIELDRDLAQYLCTRYPNAELLSMDVLEVPLDAFAARRLVGNLPYNISTPLLLRLLQQPSIIDMHFMLQHEVALRLAAVPGSKDWSRLSVMTQYRCQTEMLFPVRPDSFEPAPKVDSAFVRIQPIEPVAKADDFELFSHTVQAAFSQRRKVLANSLSKFEIPWQSLPVDSRLRADQASVTDYVQIANSIVTS